MPRLRLRRDQHQAIMQHKARAKLLRQNFAESASANPLGAWQMYKPLLERVDKSKADLKDSVYLEQERQNWKQYNWNPNFNDNDMSRYLSDMEKYGPLASGYKNPTAFLTMAKAKRLSKGKVSHYHRDTLSDYSDDEAYQALEDRG